MIDFEALVAPKLVRPTTGQSQHLIYGLVDPRTLLVRYVGASSSGLRRPNAHRNASELCKPAPHKNNWIRSLLDAGLDYTVAVLQTVPRREDLIEAEIWWIAYGHACGWDLTNATRGGQVTVEPKTRGPLAPEHIAKLRVPHSPEWVAKVAAAKRGKACSEETKRKIAKALTGKKLSDTARAKVSASLIGNKRASKK